MCGQGRLCHMSQVITDMPRAQEERVACLQGQPRADVRTGQSSTVLNRGLQLLYDTGTMMYRCVEPHTPQNA